MVSCSGRSGTTFPLRCSDMTWSVGPTSLPPMNTAGTSGAAAHHTRRLLDVLPWAPCPARRPPSSEKSVFMYGVAHAAARPEDHHRVLRRQPRPGSVAAPLGSGRRRRAAPHTDPRKGEKERKNGSQSNPN